MWMCESAISCFLLNQVSDVFHLKHQKCENVISHIKILTVKPSCSCFMHLRVTEMSEDIRLWWLAVWDQIKKMLSSTIFCLLLKFCSLQKPQSTKYVCLFEKHWKMKPFLSFWTWSRDKNKHSNWCTSVTEEFSTDVDTGQVLTEWRVSFKSVSSGP